MSSSKVTRTPYLPFTAGFWTSATTFVAVGFDCNPIMFRLGPNGFEFVDKCDKADGSGVVKTSRNMWQQLDSKGSTEGKCILS